MILVSSDIYVCLNSTHNKRTTVWHLQTPRDRFWFSIANNRVSFFLDKDSLEEKRKHRPGKIVVFGS